MPQSDLIALVLQGGAVVVLLLWVWDLRRQRDQERAERQENSAILRTMAQGLGELTNSIEALIDGQRPRPPRRRE